MTPPPPSFRMTVVDHFKIAGRGKVVCGRIEQGSVAPGDALSVESAVGDIPVVVKSVESERGVLPQAGVGENIGLLLSGERLDQIERGNVVSGAD